MTELKKIDDLGLGEALGEWAPKFVEAGAMAQKMLADNPALDQAVQDSIVMLMNELLHQDEKYGKSFQATVTAAQPEGDNRYLLTLLVSNGNPAVPKSRAWVLTPKELKETEMLWSIIGDTAKKVVESMIAAEQVKPSGIVH